MVKWLVLMIPANGATRPNVNTPPPSLATGLMSPGNMVLASIFYFVNVSFIVQLPLSGLLLIHHRVNKNLTQMCASKDWKEENLPQLEQEGNTAR